jgi:molecular chaperone DnaK
MNCPRPTTTGNDTGAPTNVVRFRGGASIRCVTSPVLAIDFGTSNSAAAWLDELGRVRVAAIRENTFLLPTAAWYSATGHTLVGQPARQQMVDDPKNTIFGLKRFLGLRFNSPFVHRHKGRFAFDIVETKDGQCGVMIGDTVKSFEDVAVDVLKRLLELATVSHGAPFEECVLTAPAHYGYAQRGAIRRAAMRAGLRVKGMVNEPTAAAMYYARKKGNDGTVLVFDLGGGTFDATLMAIVSGVVKVIATGGDAFLGGADFDAKIVDHLLARFEGDHAIDLRTDAVAVQRLLVAAEAAKIELSRSEDVRIRVPCIAIKDERFLDLELRLTRTDLENMTATLVEQAVGVCRDILKRAKLDAKQVDEIVFVGGMTRMPVIQRRLADIFIANPSQNIHPDLGVVVGAALLSQGDHSLIDVTSMSMGIALPGGGNVELVPANTVVPSVQRVEVTRPPAGQPLVFGVYEAVDVQALERDVLGTIRVPVEWLAAHPGTLTLEAWLGADLDLDLFLQPGNGEKLSLTLQMGAAQKPSPSSSSSSSLAAPTSPGHERRMSHPGFRSVDVPGSGHGVTTLPPPLSATMPPPTMPAPTPGPVRPSTSPLSATPPVAAVDNGGEPPAPKPGDTVGGYLLIDVIGGGGMGQVYLAEHKRLGRRVAMKMLRQRFGKDTTSLERFLSEARAVNQIRHENIIEVTDLFESADGCPCYIMEALEGRSLAELLRSIGAPAVERTVRIAYQVANAMVAVHDAHIIHRDIKPENIFLTQKGNREDFVKLIDFGVAKLVDKDGLSLHDTNVGARIGTLDYMPPEQIVGHTVDARADIYALGVVLYEMTTGMLPYKHAGSDRALLFAQLAEPPARPSVVMAGKSTIPHGLDDLIMECLDREPSRRPQTMREVRGRLEAMAEQTSAAPRAATQSSPVPPGASSSSASRPAPIHVGGRTITPPWSPVFTPPLLQASTRPPLTTSSSSSSPAAPPPTRLKTPVLRVPANRPSTAVAPVAAPMTPTPTTPVGVSQALAVGLVLLAAGLGLLAGWVVFGVLPGH